MGAPVDIVTGDRGQRGNRILLESRKKVEPQVIKTSGRIYSIVGLSLSASHVIDAPEGLIVVDTGSGMNEGKGILEMIRTFSSRPVGAVIYTHSHYCGGTAALVESPGQVTVWAHHALRANRANMISSVAAGKWPRIAAQSGLILPKEGEDADSAGTEVARSGPDGYVPPDRIIDKDGMIIRILGVPFVFYTDYSFDTKDTLLMHLPEDDTVIHNHLSGNFPNLYSLGGGSYRDPLPWIEGLDKILTIGPTHLLGVHGLPVSGKEKIRELVEVNRDALQFLYDQTVRAINLGLTAPETAFFVRLPKELQTHPYLQQTYGEVWHHVLSIYCGLMGWYDGDPVNLLPLHPEDESRLFIEAVGGVNRILGLAEQALKERKYSWAARLLRHALRVSSDEDRPGAAKLLAAALRGGAQVTTAWSTRNVCLTAALELEGRGSRKILKTVPDRRALSGLYASGLLRLLRFKLDPLRLPLGASQRLILRISGTDNVYALELRRGVLTMRSVGPDTGEEMNLPSDSGKAEINVETLVDILLGEKSFSDAAEEGGLRISGDRDAVLRFFSAFELK
jgi:alkyl sulfatase BDS1-like metallo-beta-lactamase superfamily hydrolase